MVVVVKQLPTAAGQGALPSPHRRQRVVGSVSCVRAPGRGHLGRLTTLPARALLHAGRQRWMDIIDLTAPHEELYCQCLEDWSADIREAGDHKRVWYAKMRDRGLRVKLAVDDAGEVGGMIQYVPIQYAPASGKDLFFINCIWVHGHQQGRGNFQKRGMGRALLEAAEDDARSLDAKGVAAWGLWLPFWMKASWFKKRGYKKADRQSIQVLVWKPFSADAEPPKWIRQRRKPPRVPGKVAITAYLNGWCPVMNLTYERAKRAAAEFGDRVHFETIDTFDRKTFADWGISDGVYVDGKSIQAGPPPSYEKIRDLIARRVRRLR